MNKYRVDITVQIKAPDPEAAWELASAGAEMMTTDIECEIIEVSEAEEVE